MYSILAVMKFVFVVALFVTNSVLFAQTKVSGKVTDAKGKPIAGASVTVENTYDGATTDSAGKFSFVSMETGNQTLSIITSGYESNIRKLLFEGKPIEVTAAIKELITELNAVVITAGAFEAGDKKKGTVLSSLDVVTTAGANADISGALKTLPGTQQVGESEGLFVRGGTATESKIFIDGNLVNNFFYSSLPGIATRGRFNPFLFKGTVFSAGGYSALYGQALSSALILESVDLPEKSEASISLSVIGAGSGWQKLAKNKKSSWGLSYNYSNLALAFAIVKQQQDFYKIPQYHVADANFRIKTKRGIIKYYGYGSQNNVGFRNADIDSAALKSSFNLKNINTYQNITWRENLNNGWKLNTGLSYSTNKDDIKAELQNSDNSKVAFPNTSPYNFKSFEVNNRAQYAQLRAVLEKRLGGIDALRFGADHFYSKEQIDFTDYNSNTYPSIVTENLSAAFAETDIYLTKNIATKIGVRSEYTALFSKWNIAPRASLAYKFKDNSQASFAYGIFYQNPERRYLPAATDAPGFSKATHYILQYQKIKNGRIFRSEVFYKNYDNLYKTANFNGAAAIANNLGSGYAQGIEFFWRDKKTLKNVDYWISYSYLDTKRDYLNFPMRITPSFAAKHTASLVVKKFALPIKTGFNASYTFASGRPYYQIKYDASQNKNVIADAGSTINFNSLSFSLNYLPALGKKDAKLFSVLVLSVTNVLNQNQVFGYNYGSINPTKVAIVPPSKRFVFIGWFISIGVDRTQDAINNNL